MERQKPFQPPETLKDPRGREFVLGGVTHSPSEPQTKFYLYVNENPQVRDLLLRPFEITQLVKLQEDKGGIVKP